MRDDEPADENSRAAIPIKPYYPNFDEPAPQAAPSPRKIALDVAALPTQSDLESLESGLFAYQVRQLLLTMFAVLILVGIAILPNRRVADPETFAMLIAFLQWCFGFAFLVMSLRGALLCRRGTKFWQARWLSRHLLVPLEVMFVLSFLLFTCPSRRLLAQVAALAPFIDPRVVQFLAIAVVTLSLASLVLYVAAHLMSFRFIESLSRAVSTMPNLQLRAAALYRWARGQTIAVVGGVLFFPVAATMVHLTNPFDRPGHLRIDPSTIESLLILVLLWLVGLSIQGIVTLQAAIGLVREIRQPSQADGYNE